MNGRRRLSRVEVMFLSRELDMWLRTGLISNVYHLQPMGVLLLKIKTKLGSQLLLIEPGFRLHITNLDYPIPPTPTPLARRWRKLLRGCRILAVKQHGFDRVVLLELSAREEKWSLVVELIDGGVAAIVDARGRVISSTQYKVMKDRSIRKGELYLFPPSRFIETTSSPDELLVSEIRGADDVEKAISSNLGMGNIAKWVLSNSGITPEKLPGQLSDEDVERILSSIHHVLSPEFKPEPSVVRCDEKADFYLKPPQETKECSVVRTASISEAIDLIHREFTPREKGVTNETASKIRKLERLKSELEGAALRSKRHADLIFSRLYDVEQAIERVRRGEPFASSDGLVNVKEVEWSSRTALLSIEGEDVEIDFNERAAVNASRKYELAKRLSLRLEEVEKELERLREAPLGKEEVVLLEQRRRREWYEKFRWGYISSGKLVIGGKDHITNEILLKKHTLPTSIVLHSDVAGAPFFTLVSEEKPSEEDIREAAQLAASYTTKAWNSKLSSLDVFWVYRSQLSKSPPSGEFLGRGAFVVRGQRNYIRGVPLALAIGIVRDSENLKVVVSTPSSVSKVSSSYVAVTPGNIKNREVAEEIAKRLFRNMGLKLVPRFIDEINSRLPGSRSSIVEGP